MQMRKGIYMSSVNYELLAIKAHSKKLNEEGMVMFLLPFEAKKKTHSIWGFRKLASVSCFDTYLLLVSFLGCGRRLEEPQAAPANVPIPQRHSVAATQTQHGWKGMPPILFAHIFPFFFSSSLSPPILTSLIKLSLRSLYIYFFVHCVDVGVMPALCFVLGRGASPQEPPNDGRRFGTSWNSPRSLSGNVKKKGRKMEVCLKKGFRQVRHWKKKMGRQFVETKLCSREVIGRVLGENWLFPFSGVTRRQLPTPKRETRATEALHGKKLWTWPKFQLLRFHLSPDRAYCY